MKQVYLTLFLIASVAFGTTAQLANGAMAPDFIITDQEGVDHTLQDYLDQGKTVFVDLFASWCGPCWTIHSNHVLENVYNTYGPDGTDEVMVFGVEVDPATTHDELIGIGPNTWGNWLEGISYPMAEHNTLASLFNLAFYPTIFAIRPSGKVLLINDYCWDNIADPSFNYVYDIISRGENDVIIGTSLTDVTLCEEFLFTGLASIFNAGTNEITSLQVDMLINGEINQTKMYSGALGEFRRSTVNFTPIVITEKSVIEFVGSMPNSVSDPTPDDNSASFKVIKASQSVEFLIHTDFWPEEISWEFRDPDGNVISSNEEFGTLECDHTYIQEIPYSGDGCYTFSISDTYGDGLLNAPITPGTHQCGTENGMNNQAMGAVSLSLDGEVVFSNINYEDGTSMDLGWNQSSAVQEIKGLNSINVYPNPVVNRLHVDFNLAESTRLKLEIVDLLGRTALDLGSQTFQAGTNRESINTSDLSNGMCLLRMTQGNAVKTIKFHVIH